MNKIGLNNSNAEIFKQRIDALIKKNNLSKALDDINDLVCINNLNKSNTVSQLGSVTLDKLCSEIGKITYRRILKNKKILPKNKNINLFIANRLAKSGGHTRLIKDYIDAFPEKNHVILITDKIYRKDLEFLTKIIFSKKNVLVKVSTDKDSENKVIWLQKNIIEISPDKIFLFNHYYDSAAVAAPQPDMNISTYFIHHGDYLLSLGLFLNGSKHIDLHKSIYKYCNKTLRINNSFIPFCSMDQGAKKSKFMKDGYLITATVGERHKLEVPYFVKYTDLIPNMLHKTNGKHIHIGMLSFWSLFKIKFNLIRFNVKQKQFIYLPWVPSIWDEMKFRNVDLYINSFPMGGGLSLVESMGAGIPSVIHCNNKAIFFSESASQMIYPERFEWNEPSDLIKLCLKLTPNKLIASGKAARNFYLKHYNSKNLSSNLYEVKHQIYYSKSDKHIAMEELLFKNYIERRYPRKILFSFRKNLSKIKHYFFD